MRRPCALVALPLAGVLLAGCGSDPADARRAGVAAVTEAANSRDAAGVRARADALLATVEAQREREQISSDEADRLVALARAVRSGADVIDEDLLERRRAEAEAEAEAAKKQLEEARKQLEEERRKAEEAANKGEEERKGEGKGSDKDEDKDD